MNFDFPDLRRPQYPSSPEILLSSLAWSVVQRNPENTSSGLMYRRRAATGSRKVKIAETMPQGEMLVAFQSRLREHGIFAASSGLDGLVAEAITDAMLGIQPTKGQGTASSCVGMAGALMQDTVGGLGVANPPNFAQLINTIYALGGPTARTAADAWFEAASHYSSDDRILQSIERALVDTTLRPFVQHETWPPERPMPAQTSLADAVPEWWRKDVIDPRTGTPFQWFRVSWDRLCSPEWYQVLSARRWASWAVCLLRNALGFAFLWEANFFIEIARAVEDRARDADTSARWAISPSRPLLPNPKGSITQRDVAPGMKRMLTHGLACRKAILDLVTRLETCPANLPSLIRGLRGPASQGDEIRSALRGGGDKSGLSNLYETVRYSLLSRESADEPDESALMRVMSRRFTHVSPGPEWIVVMSAMASESPSAVIRLGDVEQCLNALGLQPKIDFLLGELERAGLCASAADGDQGIEINLGFHSKGT